jgi:anthranilate 1,2-dioxygenase (deaminating, decarboxylating) large subunit
MRRTLGLVLTLAIICVFAAPAHALMEPLGINLGFTNFLDGASPGPGWYLTEYFQMIRSDDIENHLGLPTDADLDVFVNLNQIIYQSNVNFLGGNPGIDVIIPLVDIDIEHPVLSGQDGFGDILIGPFIQWGPHMIFNRPYFHRFEFQVILPTGDNDADVFLNPGADVVSLNPYYSFTYFITPKLSTSWRIHYLWSEENEDTKLIPGLSDIQAGDAIHFNYAMAYQVTDVVRLGVAGYYLKQIEEDEFDGVKVPDSEEEVFAIGPGLVWHINKDLTFMGAINFETSTDSRPKGTRTTLRLIWKFW